MTRQPDDGRRVLILAPRGRDAAVAAALLAEIGIASSAYPDLATLAAALDDDAGFVVIIEEAVLSEDLRPVTRWIDAQPTWSDLPFIIATNRGGGLERNPVAIRLSEAFGNVTFLERPFHPTTFASLAQSAARGRQRQYEARARIDELHEGEQRLRTALLAGRLGAWELDLTTRLLSASEMCRTVFGRDANQAFTYRDLVAGIHAEDRAGVEAAIQGSAEGGGDITIEFRHRWPDGSVHWAELRARLVRGRDGWDRRLVGVASDITGRRLAEQDLRELNQTLEQRVAERTAELVLAHQAVLDEIGQREQAEEKLRQAQKMEMIGQLTGGVAHDFNNLLMVVLGNLDLLRKRIPADPKAARLIDGALEGARRGAALTQRLLAFARQQDLQVRPTDLVGLIRGMTGLIERSAGPAIELRIELPESLPPAMADANQLELALLNLVVNARDAMPDGGTVSIEVARAEPPPDIGLGPGRYLRLAIVDTGQGMDGETLRRATEPFFTTKEVGRGTGLGLSMIHGLARQLGGALHLESELGRGTRVELWLPVSADDPAPADGQAPAGPAIAVAESKVAILVVDDDFLVAASTASMLEDLDHDVVTAQSGADALDILRSGRSVDMLITDYSMPGMTGLQLAEAARALRPDLPIILATGFADLPADTSIELPRLEKPYRQDQLAKSIAEALRPR